MISVERSGGGVDWKRKDRSRHGKAANGGEPMRKGTVSTGKAVLRKGIDENRPEKTRIRSTTKRKDLIWQGQERFCRAVCCAGKERLRIELKWLGTETNRWAKELQGTQ